MNKNLIWALGLIGLCSCNQEMKYPETAKIEQTDVYFGQNVEDPYRWLEDDRSAETEAWVGMENDFTQNYLSKIGFREELKERLTELWNYEKVGTPFKEGAYTYFYKNNGLQNQSVLFRKNSEGVEEVFLDPNNFSEEGTTSLGGISFSKDASLFAYSISEGGSDWRKIIVLNTETKEQIEKEIVDVKFSGISWKGEDGFFYSSYDKPEGSELSAKTDQHKLYYHKIGTDQSEDVLYFGQSEENKRRYVSAQVTEDDKYLLVSAANSTYGNELYLLDLESGSKEFTCLVDNFDSDIYLAESDENRLFFVTDKDAPNKKLIALDVSKGDYDSWTEIIPETENVLSLSSGSNYFFAEYMVDAISKVKQYDFDGVLVREVELPGVGSASGISGKEKDEVLYYSFSNYTTPSTSYQFDPKSGISKAYIKPDVDFNSEDYESKQVFYNSADGTKVPMIITYKKGLDLNGNNPTILYGYGGFNISLTPSFSIANSVWLEQGGVYAVANLRGGGEYGKKWHVGGIQTDKQNVFDDFIAAAEYLIQEKYTSSEYLAIRGGSNGGLLVGACMTQRPELFQVALPAVGVLDMLRYHTFTAGAGWAYDYGTSEQSEEMFKYLLGYSPVHNVREGVEYPATMVTTGDHDDRVVPAHSFKFAAELQAKQAGPNPVLIRIETDAGHGAGTPVSKTIEQYADIYGFTLYNMGFRELAN